MSRRTEPPFRADHYQLGGVSRAEEKLRVQFFSDGGTLDFTPAALRINEGNFLTYEEEVAKLRLIVETVAEVWG